MSDIESPPLSFEAALAELQRIAAQLEDGSTGLEQGLKDFGRGVELLQTCYRLLDAAELQIEQLVGFDANGNPQTAPFDATATVEQPGQSAGKRRRAPPRAPQSNLDFEET
ncbi:MAG TPA: exodeoxyribonuclease VII small subunit [Planctomycetaceae bacterium]|jgi:exodeoxyribonuclease VII small subunit|nr:exodeoxyribonuclease VII small subunit [Planctomycetaceae bacterium]